jgi:hypothetical protein
MRLKRGRVKRFKGLLGKPEAGMPLKPFMFAK